MHPSRPLAQGISINDVANASRLALNEFIALDPTSGDALTSWLAGAYSQAVSFGPGGAPLELRHQVVIYPNDIVTAQRAAVSAIEAASNASPESLIGFLPSFLDVVAVHDSSGAEGFAPIDRTRTGLITRALTLLLADFLTRPDDYASIASIPYPPDSH